jgi:TRAP-type C4-dicarboxylate transport system permease small subunit
MADEIDNDDLKPIDAVTKKASRFSKEFLATVISLVSTAFGVVVALAWNTAIQKWFEHLFGTAGQVAALFVYALTVTFLGVLVIVYLGRLAARLGTQPVEFKFPGTPKS